MIRVTLIFMFCSIGVIAQELIPIGTWRSHFNYEQGYWIEESENKIFATAKNGLTYYDPSDNSLTKLSKLDGLNDSEISALAYNSNTDILVLGYSSGNIDVISSEGIENYRALIESNVIDDKSILNISFYNDNVNLATSFGLLVLELETGLIRDAYRNLGESGEIIIVKKSSVWDNKIFLATPVGVLMGDLVSGANLQDFNNWERFIESPVYNQDILSVAAFNNTIYAITTNTIYKLENEDWQVINKLDISEEFEYLRLHVENNRLLIIHSQGLNELNSSDEIEVIGLIDTETPNDALVSNTGDIWYVDSNQGLTKFIGGESTRFVLPGPVNDEVHRLSVQNSTIVTYPIIDENTGSTPTNGYGFSTFDEGVWNTYSVDDLQSLDNITMYHETNGVEYVASFGKGLLDKTQGVIYDETNSPLTTINDNILITGLDSDLQNNLWVSSISNTPLVKLSTDGVFSSFSLGITQTEPTSIQINNSNQIWMTLGLDNGSGVTVFDIESETSRHISSSTTDLPSNDVNDITFDKDGAIWFATELGVAFFASPFGIVDDTGTDVILPVIDNNFLFREENVNAITVDGGNRKWMATENGAWLFDEDINESLLNFTTENSPLPSNNILDIAINGATGEVFFATDLGIVSYRSDATEVSLAPSNVSIYPNPVTSNFQGTVGFQGLIGNANLKITTISGRLVREIEGSGAAASWDLNDYNGSRIRTGIYLVFSASSDGSESYVGKIAVVN